MKPEDFLKKAQSDYKKMGDLKKKSVAVGILANEATGRVYKNGMNVLQVGAIHELGLGNSPQRSFIRMPAQVKAKEINSFISKELVKVFDGASVEKGLGRIGMFNVNIIQDAFSSEGFGKWTPLSTDTVKSKGSSKALTDKGILKSSINYEVR